MALTWGDIGLIFVVVLVGCLVAGFIAAWWEDRKWKRDKNKRG
ncbi:hypothetical protein ES705_18692 [subsurface metagenome]